MKKNILFLIGSCLPFLMVSIAYSSDAVKLVTGSDIELFIDGSTITNASILKYKNSQCSLRIELNEKAALKLGEMTEKNIGKPIKIYFNNEVLAAPIVSDKFLGKSMIFTVGTCTKTQTVLSAITE